MLQKLGARMEVRKVDLAKMMQLVEECSKEGSRDGEVEPDDEETGVFGLGLLTVKRGIMPGYKVKIFFKLYTICKMKIEKICLFRNSVVWGG